MLVWLAAWAAFAISAAPAMATQHLIRPGDDWSELGPRLRPGDEIILMPGRHRSASLDHVRGTASRPIIIRGLDPKHPSTIDAHREGLRLRRPLHVVIRDLGITGATVNGITITDEHDEPPGNDEPREERAPYHGHVTIENVNIERTGPSGRRHAIQLAGVEQIDIRDCRMSGWGGAAIEMTAVLNVSVRDCRFSGRSEYSQLAGIQARAGSDRVNVEDCIFDNVGAVAVVIGGTSALDEFRLVGSEDAQPGTVYEARRIQVRHCLIRGGDTAVAFINCVDSRFAGNTIVNPRRWVYAIHDEPRDPIFNSMRRCAFGANLIVWEPGDLDAFSFAAEDVPTQGLTLEQNLWWSPELDAARRKLGELHGAVQWSQVMDVDPKLDAAFEPTDPRAAVYGMTSP